ncbi:MAG: PD-(D/E)XK nuclease family protein, partial [Bacteroidales bacterium]|nr:PD-(D/E)XK nuclease family protein [Bacteroidales bacterium]
SRFITQTEYELDLYEDLKELQENNKTPKYHQIKSFNINPQQSKNINITKNDAIRNKIDELLGCKGQKFIYPSAITTFLTCKLQFYFKYVLGLKEAENVDDDTTGLDFGNLLHNAMFFLYQDYIGQEVPKEHFKILKQKVDEAVKFAAKTVFNISDDEQKLQNALNNIMIMPLKEYIHKILDLDKKYAPFYILDLENTKIHASEGENVDYSISIPIKLDDVTETKNVRIGGKIDRIDEKGRVIRVIDYKTANIPDPKRYFKKDSLEYETFEQKELIQVLIYSEILVQRHEGDNYQILPSIFCVNGLGNTDLCIENKNRKFADYKNDIYDLDGGSDSDYDHDSDSDYDYDHDSNSDPNNVSVKVNVNVPKEVSVNVKVKVNNNKVRDKFMESLTNA